MIIFTIIKAILGIVAAISFVWMVVGLPLGVILTIAYLVTKEKEKKKKLSKWIKLSFVCILVLIVVFIFWALLSFVSTLLGYNLGSSIPGILK